MELYQYLTQEGEIEIDEKFTFSEGFISFLELALKKNADERSNSIELMAHPWINSQLMDIDEYFVWFNEVTKE